MIASLDFMLRVTLIPRGVIDHGGDKPWWIQSERYPIQANWLKKAKACRSFPLYLKVFRNHLYYLWHVRVLFIKPYLHTQLPEYHGSYWKVFPGVGAFDHLEWTYNGAFEQLFGLGRGNLNKIFPKIQIPGGCQGGMFKLRFDWYINLTWCKSPCLMQSSSETSQVLVANSNEKKNISDI